MQLGDLLRLCDVSEFAFEFLKRRELLMHLVSVRFVTKVTELQIYHKIKQMEQFTEVVLERGTRKEDSMGSPKAFHYLE